MRPVVRRRSQRAADTPGIHALGLRARRLDSPRQHAPIMNLANLSHTSGKLAHAGGRVGIPAFALFYWAQAWRCGLMIGPPRKAAAADQQRPTHAPAPGPCARERAGSSKAGRFWAWVRALGALAAGKT